MNALPHLVRRALLKPRNWYYHRAKLALIKRYRRKYQLRTFVETGSWYGDMINNVRTWFDQIYSVELSPELAEHCRIRYDDFDHIQIVQGDSGKVLEWLVPELKRPALFLLDAHFSGGVTAKGDMDTPIERELASVLASPLHHIVLIDDARLFGTDPAYPKVSDLRVGNRKLTVRGDVIVIE